MSLKPASTQEFQAVCIKFKSAWVKGTCPSVSYVFVVTNTKLEPRWRRYLQNLTLQDVEEHYHGTMLTCNITATNTLCRDENCGICGICSVGLDRRCIQKNISFQRFGHGFYLAPNSSKCHDYTQGACGFRAMLLCDVAAGKKYILQANDQKLLKPPEGYDSVYGKGVPGSSSSVLNYDEIVIYNPDCVLPRYVIVYKHNGTHKIAT